MHIKTKPKEQIMLSKRLKRWMLAAAMTLVGAGLAWAEVPLPADHPCSVVAAPADGAKPAPLRLAKVLVYGRTYY